METLNQALASDELHKTLEELLGSPGVRLITQQKLSGSRVHRVQVEVCGTVRSLILKRLRPHVALRNEMVARRWLPAVGLSQAAAHLLGIAAEREGKRVWHIYEDLSDCALVEDDSRANREFSRNLCPRVFRAEPERVKVAASLIAEIHARFAEHPLLAECRLYGDDFGTHFYISGVKDAIRGLEALLADHRQLSGERTALLNRLLIRMQLLMEQQAERANVIAQFGGPETLLHGDLWPTNVMVDNEGGALRARVIDWDHVGVGPISYDLSNFLAHFPIQDRQGILEIYIETLERLGWSCLPDTDWNLLFETAEYARLAKTVTWGAIGALDDPPDWAFDDLAAVDQWFEIVKPVLPPECSNKEVRR